LQSPPATKLNRLLHQVHPPPHKKNLASVFGHLFPHRLAAGRGGNRFEPRLVISLFLRTGAYHA
jgi:hypothetical protein